jgi:16S rRNA processing protein RimM
VSLAPGKYYVSDLAGCEVFEQNGARIGLVQDVQFTGEDIAGTPVLVVASPKGEVLIPLAQDICVSVDTDARRIEVQLPEGLLDLNE